MYQVLQTYPGEEWLTRLRKGNIIYLAKEQCYAEVEWPYEPPGPQSICGRVGLRFFNLLSGGRREYTGRDTWFIRPSGRGIDGSQCLLPVEGHVPDNPPPLPPEDIRYILRRLDWLESILLDTRQVVPTTIEVPASKVEIEDIYPSNASVPKTADVNNVYSLQFKTVDWKDKS